MLDLLNVPLKAHTDTMTNFHIFDGNRNEFDTREYGQPHQLWSVGTYVPLVNFMDDVRIFLPRFRKNVLA